jgi:hypothetical protein
MSLQARNVQHDNIHRYGDSESVEKSVVKSGVNKGRRGVISRRLRVGSVRVAVSVPHIELAFDQTKHTYPLHSLLYIIILSADVILNFWDPLFARYLRRLHRLHSLLRAA